MADAIVKVEKPLEIGITPEQLEYISLNRLFSNFDYLSVFLDNFDKRWFKNDRLKIIFNVALNYYGKYKKLPTKNVLELIFDKLDQAKQLKSFDNKQFFTKNELIVIFDNVLDMKIDADDEFIKTEVLKFIKYRAGYLAILDNLEDIQKENEDKINLFIERFQKIAGITFNNEIGFKYFEMIDQHGEEVCNPASRLPTGFSQLDRITNGGVYADGRCLIVLMAQPGLGKSMLMTNLTYNFLKQNKFPLVISLEMSELIYGMRFDALIAKENINGLQFCWDKVKDKIESFKNLYPGSNLLIKEYPPATITCNHINAYLEKLKRLNMMPDVLIIDYIQLLKPATRNSKNDDSYTTVGNIVKELRALSYKFRIPVISATQSNKGGYNTSDVSMENTSESAQINHHADFIGALFQEEGDLEANKLSMKILKNRLGGQQGKILNFHVNYMNLSVTDMVKCENKDENQMKNEILDEVKNL